MSLGARPRSTHRARPASRPTPNVRQQSNPEPTPSVWQLPDPEPASDPWLLPAPEPTQQFQTALRRATKDYTPFQWAVAVFGGLIGFIVAFFTVPVHPLFGDISNSFGRILLEFIWYVVLIGLGIVCFGRLAWLLQNHEQHS